MSKTYCPKSPKILRMISAFIFVAAISASAQAPALSPLLVDSLTASKNLISMPPPVYPMHAKQLHIKGSVVLEVSVDASGKVTSVRVVSGPQELQQAAVDAFSQAKYKPFQKDGKPSAAVVSTKINFQMNNESLSSADDAISHQYFVSHEQCEALTSQKKPDALSVCLSTVDLSRKFSSGAELESRAVAYSEAAQLLIRAGRIQEAAKLGDEVVPLVAPAGRVSQASATAYMTRAFTRAASANQTCIADLDEVISILGTLKEKETSPVFIKMFQRERVQALELKATVLHDLGREAEARQAKKEATIP